MALHRAQVAIVGGGIIGLSAAVELAQRGRQVILIERGAAKSELPATQQLRVSAISPGSIKWLSRMGVWQTIPQSRLGAYSQMRVWDKDTRGAIEFDAAEVGIQSLGVIVENAVLEHALWQKAASLGVTLVSDVTHAPAEFSDDDVTLTLDNGDIVLSQLLIAADGAQSSLRQQAGIPVTFKDYEQKGVVATISCAEPHGGMARQVFMAGGPLALLPLADPHQVSIVWSRPSDDADQLLALDEQQFNQRLSAASDNCLGTLSLSSERAAFPLTMRYAERWVEKRQVLMGDAAHTIHPLAGQGANLGLADARVLTERLGELGTLQGRWDEAELSRTLRSYERARKAAAVERIAAMEGFHQLFRTSNPLVRAVRSHGLSLVNHLTPVKRFFINQALE